MWRLVREGLRVYRPVLLISWAVGVGIFLLVVTIVAVVGSVKDRAELANIGTQLPVAILIASMIAGFIVTGTERSESRVRMHVMLPLSIGDVALARVLVPAVFILLGILVSHVAFGALLALRGTPFAWSRHLNVDFIGLLLLFWPQVALAIREVIELRHRVRFRGALASKALLIIAVALTIVVQLPAVGSVGVRAGALVALDAAVMLFTVALFLRRTAFTK